MTRLLGLIGGLGLLAMAAGCGGDAAQAECFKICDKESACMMSDPMCGSICANAHSAGCSNQTAILAYVDGCLAKDCNSYKACLNDPSAPACTH
ncbi:MAG TPA: hypothetical protein VFF06_22700 [Polyangia bacterium]|nr:hypothetical protein [Polyangia bacterium]